MALTFARATDAGLLRHGFSGDGGSLVSKAFSEQFVGVIADDQGAASVEFIRDDGVAYLLVDVSGDELLASSRRLDRALL